MLIIGTFAYPIFFTAQNAIMKKNYPDNLRGRVFGLIYSFSGFLTIMVSLFLGRFYDFFKTYILFAYLIGGIAGFLSNYFMAQIEEKMSSEEILHLSRPIDILKTRKDFLFFEASFFSYGSGFMMMLPLLPLFLVDYLKVSYSEASMMNGLFYQGAIVLSSWIIGRMIDSFNPLKFVKAGFFLLIFYPIFMLFTKGVSFAYFVYAYYGISLAIVNVSWYLAPLSFCRVKEEGSTFMGIHVALAGVRSFIAFPLGTYLFHITNSFIVPFLIASTLFFIGFIIVPTKTQNVV